MGQTYSLQAVMAGYPSGSYICHHGIKGQKWGVRRYQNDDGSLTPEGERRYRQYLRKYHKRVNGQKEFSTETSKRYSEAARSVAVTAELTAAGIGGAFGGPLVAAGILTASAIKTILSARASAIKREEAREFMLESGKLTDDQYRRVLYSKWTDRNIMAEKRAKEEAKNSAREDKANRKATVDASTPEALKKAKSSLDILSDGRALRDLSKEVYGGQTGAYSKLMAATSYVDEYKTALYKKYKGNQEATAELERIYGKPGDNTKIMRDLMKKEPRLKNAYRDYPEELRQIMRTT